MYVELELESSNKHLSYLEWCT